MDFSSRFEHVSFKPGDFVDLSLTSFPDTISMLLMVEYQLKFVDLAPDLAVCQS